MDAAVWQRVSEDRRQKKRRGFGFISLMVIANLLVAVSLFGLLSVFGPVVFAEGRYQLAQIVTRVDAPTSLREWIAPTFSFHAVSSKVADYGLVIPKIYVEEEISLNVDPANEPLYKQALLSSVAHAAGTSLPGDGGLGYYFAHSSGPVPLGGQQRATFYLLGKLEQGDEVYLYRGGKRYAYAVTSKEILEASDVSFLKRQVEVEEIVLQTCWPIGTNQRRLVVFAERVS